MRCSACNRPFHATLLTAPNGKVSFEKLCSDCKSPKGESYAYSFDFLYAIEEEPVVRVAKEKSISIQPY